MAEDEEKGFHEPREHRPKKQRGHIIFSLVLLVIVFLAGCCYGYLGLTPNYTASYNDGFSGRKVFAKPFQVG
jgi:hypothetical protein